ncbi:MAG: carbohydate-binding domain-containing protein [Dysgonamonadaceae bacterium]|jgi:hexosaminidase|nr:carbohydate-binding domain-containing protein [Dysgonamonadaceae bacterium]
MLKKSLLLLLCLPLSFSCARKPSEPVSLVWEMVKNGVEPGVYETRFHIKNNSGKALEANWAIYFTGNPDVPLVDDATPLKVEQIMATYFKMSPTEHYKPVEAGKTLEFSYRINGALIKESSAPTGAYIVFTDGEGRESEPQSLAVEVVPFDRPEQWTRPGRKELPYPDGKYVYRENELFQEPVDLNVFDIFPSIKMIDYQNDKDNCTFTKNIRLKYPAELENEAQILKEKLETLCGCTVSDTGETLVELKNKKTCENFAGYNISISNDGLIIAGNGTEGVFNGCMSLLNIVGNIPDFPAALPACLIYDFPDIHHRGVMLDVSRNFTKKENVLKLLDILALYKINVFHWHLTDDEGWRLEIPGLPELTEIGSRRGHTHDESQCLYPAYAWGWNPDDTTTLANGFYTRNDFIEVLKHAAKLHIKVIPEIDIPGHSRAAIKAMNARYKKYIESDPAKAEEYLLTDFADTSKYISAQIYTDNVLNAAMPSTYHFLEKIIDEVNKMYQEAGLKLEIFHIGGDEVPNGVWTGSEICTRFMKEKGMKEIRELKDYFLEQVLPMLASRGIQPAGWEEVAMKPDGSANEKFRNSNVLSYCWNTIPEWNSDQAPYRLANGGYPIVLCNVTNFYTDMSYSRHQCEPGLYWGGFVNEFNTFDALPYDIYRSVRRDLNGNPYNLDSMSQAKLPLTEGAEQRIRGIQCQVWAETVRNFEQVQYFLFPKVLGMADRAWNARPEWSLTNDNSAYEVAKRKYNAKIGQYELPRLAKMGVNFHLAQPGFIVKDGLLYTNAQYPKAEIRYTTDGSEPTEKSALWTKPTACKSENIKAKAFYLGKKSVTTRN